MQRHQPPTAFISSSWPELSWLLLMFCICISLHSLNLLYVRPTIYVEYGVVFPNHSQTSTVIDTIYEIYSYITIFLSVILLTDSLLLYLEKRYIVSSYKRLSNRGAEGKLQNRPASIDYNKKQQIGNDRISFIVLKGLLRSDRQSNGISRDGISNAFINTKIPKGKLIALIVLIVTCVAIDSMFLYCIKPAIINAYSNLNNDRPDVVGMYDKVFDILTLPMIILSVLIIITSTIILLEGMLTRTNSNGISPTPAPLG